jgi:hypothetical protein
MLVTLARAASGVATKRHRLGPAGEVVTEGYPEGESRWALYRHDLRDLPALVGTMREIPMDTCLLRGEPVPFVLPGSLTRRRLGETLLDCPTELIVYDIDSLPMPACLDPSTDPLDGVLYAVSRLPDEHQDRSFAFAYSASAGFSRDKLKLKLFFQASEPLESETARAYQKGVNEAAGFKLLDPCVTAANQPIYVAPPICEAPLRDPLNGRRYGFWQGLEDRVTLDLTRCAAGTIAAGGVLGTGWRRHLARIGTEAGFRDPIVGTVSAAVAEAGGIPEDLDALHEEIAAAVLAADPGGRDRRTIQRYASAVHTREIALWAARRQARQAAQVEQLRDEIFRTKS